MSDSNFTASSEYLKGVSDERQRILDLIEYRLDHVEVIAQSIGQGKYVYDWEDYIKGLYLELERFSEVITGDKSVLSDVK